MKVARSSQKPAKTPESGVSALKTPGDRGNARVSIKNARAGTISFCPVGRFSRKLPNFRFQIGFWGGFGGD